jgi:hypothetical protein
LGRSPLQKRDVEKIAAKLGAEVKKDGAHQRAFFRHNGKLILDFGIRHGTRSGHGFLCGAQGALRMNEKRVVAMAACTVSKAEYVEHLKSIGLIVGDD